MSESRWFEGLKYAEKYGLGEACMQYMQNEFDESDPLFVQGVLDYIAYAKEILKGGEL